jgi:hypothetical protein
MWKIFKEAAPGEFIETGEVWGGEDGKASAAEAQTYVESLRQQTGICHSAALVD